MGGVDFRTGAEVRAVSPSVEGGATEGKPTPVNGGPPPPWGAAVADTSESRGWLGVLYPLGDGVLISEAVVELVLGGPTLETSELRRAVWGAHSLSDENPKRNGFFDDGRVLQGRRTRLTALAATLAILALRAISVSTPATASLRIAVRVARVPLAKFSTYGMEL